jgi:NADH-quinone oxidoreductase subunit F
MHRFNSVEELRNFRKSLQVKVEPGIPCLIICAGTGGQASGSNDIIRVIKRYIIENNLQEKIELRVTGCQGFCEMDPFIIVEPGRQLYSRLNMNDVPRVIDAALHGQIVEELLYRESEHHECQCNKDEIPFFKKQKRTILGANETLDPIRVYDYIKRGGYSALEKAIEKRDPAWIYEEVKKSGLRGRGGGGFPTGTKWELAHKSESKDGQKYVICNADEGDPGAYMDRSVLEGNPQLVLEGMIIAGIAIGATQGYIYVRSEYPLAIKHTLIAISQAKELGFLGKNILGSDYQFNIEIVRGAGAFVCGEETALIRSIEGFVGEPRQRPPYPIEKGLWGKPTCINNVETLANIPVIIEQGAEEYAQVGVPNNSGTKIFSLVGKVRNTGLVEVPMGITINEIVNDIGGGPISKKAIKAVQTGGPSGGCIPAKMFDLPIDYDSLAQAGSIMGSGGMIVMDEGTCMVDIAKYYMKFLKDESCGKCFTCRKGTQRMYEMLEDISQGRGTMEQLDLLEELALVVRDTTMCGLGQTASNPVLSTLKYFRDEYIEHIRYKRCRAVVCKELVGAPCQATCPIGTEAWRYIAHIAQGEYELAYLAIRETNPFPSVCARVCDHKCESNCRLGTTGVSPVAIRALKRFVTDTVEPAVYKPIKISRRNPGPPEVAIIGSGPAGLTAAHELSLNGYGVTVFEAEDKPGGMLWNCIPAYRLPREVMDKEISSLLDENIKLECGKKLGENIDIEGLLKQGYKSVFLAIGAQKGRSLRVTGEDSEGVYPSIEFLKAFNIEGKSWAKGRVGIIGGGNSAFDSARTALRQPGVESVTIIYRRTFEEMTAFEEEIKAAEEEGIKIMTLVTPTKILSVEGHCTGIECLKNRLGEIDASGRRKPIPIPGSEFYLPFETIIIAISEQPNTDSIPPATREKLKIKEGGVVEVNPRTLQTTMPGVFAGGDVVTGPNTVVDAIAAGRKAALMIHRYLNGQELDQPENAYLPEVHIESVTVSEEELAELRRVEPPKADAVSRRKHFEEVEKTMNETDACKEAKRCLRCDLDFTTKAVKEETPEVSVKVLA